MKNILRAISFSVRNTFNSKVNMDQLEGTSHDHLFTDDKISPDTRRYYEIAAPRWNLTWHFLKNHLRAIPENGNLLGLGSDGAFESRLLTERIDVNFFVSEFDLRERFPIASASMDGIICLEVVEHLKDPDSKLLDLYSSHYLLGLFNCLVEANRVLKPEGKFFLTTPNTASWGSLYRSLRGESNYLYWPHVREYAPFEFSYYLNRAGFEIIQIETFSPYPDDYDPNLLQKFLLSSLSYFVGAHVNIGKYRGSTLSIVAQKISPPEDPLMQTEFRKILISDLPCSAS